jgi:hypothetical protein
MPSLERLVTWLQIPEGRTSAGLILVIVFAIALLVGGIFLLVRSGIDLVRNRKSSRRSEDVDRKKAA